MNPQTLLLIMQGVQLAGTLVPSTLEAALKIKALLSVDGSDFTVQIRVMQDGVLKEVEEGDALIDAWKTEHGYV